MEIRTDVLIIGSGIAGLYSAIKCAEFCNVIIVTKKEKSDSSTNFAQGGIASVIGSDDSYVKHIEDTLIAGAGLCNKEMVKILVENGPERINELIEIGAEFTFSGGKLELGQEGGHSRKRIIHSKDFTGKEIEKTLINKVNSLKNIQIIENTLAIDLITEHHIKELKNKQIELRNCYGAYVLDISQNKVIKIISKFTVLATGGLGQVYFHTTNPSISTGDGYAIAYRAGAKIANMEFIQFHPTALYSSQVKNKNSSSFLISEAVRGYGGILKTLKNDSFMEMYDFRKELAPRDIVARAIDSELKRSGDDYVCLDISFKDKNEIIDKFPTIYSKCLENGIDITKELIPVVPAAHYCCGGILVDYYSRTSLNCLFAIGEVANTGVHGANRLASNSLLEALVFSFISCNFIKTQFGNASKSFVIPDWDIPETLTYDEMILIAHSLKELKQLMWDYVGIVRSDLRLNYALRRINNLSQEIEDYYKKNKIFPSLLELRNMITCSQLIVTSALNRKESRGLHYNIDYPDKSDKYLFDTIIQNFDF